MTKVLVCPICGKSLMPNHDKYTYKVVQAGEICYCGGHPRMPGGPSEYKPREVLPLSSPQETGNSKEDEVVERMARVGFETMDEDKWDELKPSSALRHMWLGVASEMLTELRRTWEQAKRSVR